MCHIRRQSFSFSLLLKLLRHAREWISAPVAKCQRHFSFSHLCVCTDCIRSMTTSTIAISLNPYAPLRVQNNGLEIAIGCKFIICTIIICVPLLFIVATQKKPRRKQQKMIFFHFCHTPRAPMTYFDDFV